MTTLVPTQYANVMTFGAKGTGVGDDTAAFQAALDTGRGILIPAGTYNITNLTMATNSSLIGFGQASVLNLSGTITLNDYCTVQELTISTTGYTATAFTLGTTASATTGVLLDRLTVTGYALFLDCFWGRKLRVTGCKVYTTKGIYYHGRSAENYVDQNWFVNNGGTYAGSYGIYSTNSEYSTDITLFPEGLNLTNNLIYGYETSVFLEDLFVGNFSNNYYSNYSASNSGEYNLKCTRRVDYITDTGSWYRAKGILFDPVTNYRYETVINGCNFTNLNDTGCGVYLGTSAHSVTVTNCRMQGLYSTDATAFATLYGVYLQSDNRNITLDNINTKDLAYSLVTAGSQTDKGQKFSNITADIDYSGLGTAAVTGNPQCWDVSGVDSWAPLTANTFNFGDRNTQLNSVSTQTIYGGRGIVVERSVTAGSPAQTLLVTIPASGGQWIFDVYAFSSRSGTTVGTSSYAHKQFYVVRKDSSTNVVLGALTGAGEFELTVPTAGGAVNTSAIALSIARTGAEAATAPQQIAVSGTFDGSSGAVRIIIHQIGSSVTLNN